MSVEHFVENVFLFFVSWEQFLAWVPAHGVGILTVDSGVKLGRAGQLSPPLLAKLIRSVAEHDSFIVANGSFGHLAK